MSTIPQISEAMQMVLTTKAEELARSTGFVQRQSPLNGPGFAQTTVFGWMKNAQASYAQLQQTASSLDIEVSAQAIEQRFSDRSALFLQRLLEEAVRSVISDEQETIELFKRFNGVYLQDGTTNNLVERLAAQWKGCGASSSSLQVQVRLNLATGGMQGPWLQDGRANECRGKASVQETPLPQGALWVVDMGYFHLREMRVQDEAGRFWLSPAKANLKIFDRQGVEWDLLSYLRKHQPEGTIDHDVRVGKRERVPMRLIAVRVSEEQAQQRRERAQRKVRGPRKGVQKPGQKTRGRRPRKRKSVSVARLRLAEWTVILTNVPREMLTVSEAVVLLRARWQIELLWKLWKSEGQVDTWRSEKPWRILSEVYAKMLGLVITHWLTVQACWHDPARSMVKAHQVIVGQVSLLIYAFSGRADMNEVLTYLFTSMQGSCRLNSRAKRPNTYQLLQQPQLILS